MNLKMFNLGGNWNGFVKTPCTPSNYREPKQTPPSRTKAEPHDVNRQRRTGSVKSEIRSNNSRRNCFQYVCLKLTFCFAPPRGPSTTILKSSVSRGMQYLAKVYFQNMVKWHFQNMVKMAFQNNCLPQHAV